MLTGLLLALAVGVHVAYTGPAFEEHRARRRYLREGGARLVSDNAECALCKRKTCRFAATREPR